MINRDITWALEVRVIRVARPPAVGVVTIEVTSAPVSMATPSARATRSTARMTS